VFVTDSILTTIMCAAKSVYSWDVVVTRVGDKLFFDKREGSSLDLLTVNETAPEQVGPWAVPVLTCLLASHSRCVCVL
jgi:translation initiation factor 3 subunit D